MDKSPLQLAVEDLTLFYNALGPYRDSFVLCGAFAVLLYRDLDAAVDLDTEPLLTTDHDWVVPRPLPKMGQESLSTLPDNAGFVIVLSRGSRPPKQFIQQRRFGSRAPASVYGELLTPRKGSEGNQSIDIQAGITAQALPFLSVLLDAPIEHDCKSGNLLGFSVGTRVRVPQPLWFVMQKILMRRAQGMAWKAEKDYASAYEVVRLFSEEWPAWAFRLDEAKRKKLFPAKWFQRFQKMFIRAFSGSSAPGCLAVMSVHSGSPIRPEFEPESVATVMNAFQSALWSSDT